MMSASASCLLHLGPMDYYHKAVSRKEQAVKIFTALAWTARLSILAAIVIVIYSLIRALTPTTDYPDLYA